ncbi:oxidoreductase [Fulvitalea axinellae]|uniref:Oxidoreductase n=1 Tax=Fulvitalea axinellae TaxID=1182444 RepID=A0AAU9CNC2_9BACT|nr:oxidoreductase [Fulvitalea axinellae]
MRKKTIGFGVIGLGAIADFHIRSIKEAEACELKAISVSRPEKTEAAKNEYNVDVYSDFREMVSRPDIDIVCICTPSGAHLEPTLVAAKAGKHVLTEKPLEVTVERAEQMIQACDDAGVKLGCIFQNRFKTDYLKLKEAVRNGELGDLLLGNAYIKWFRDQEYYASKPWRGTFAGDGGAALINQSIHTIDLLLDIMGDVDWVNGNVRTLRHNIEGEDVGVAHVAFKNNAIGTIEGATAVFPGYPERLEIHGTKGGVVLEGGKIKVWNVPGATHDDDGGGELKVGASDPLAIDHAQHKFQIEDMADAVRNGTQPAVSGKDALASLKLIKAVYASSKKKGAPVTL